MLCGIFLRYFSNLHYLCVSEVFLSICFKLMILGKVVLLVMQKIECPFVGLTNRCYRQCRRSFSVVRVHRADWTMFDPTVHQDPIQVSPTWCAFLFPRKDPVKFGASLFTSVSWVSCPRLKQTSHAWSYQIFALFLMIQKEKYCLSQNLPP